MVASAQGRDFSSYQKPVTVAQLRGLSFAYTRVSNWSGTTMGVDTTFAGDWAAIKDAGLHRGCYWWLHLDVSAVAQANYFVAAVKKAGLAPGDMLVCDSEVPGANAGAMTHAFCSEVAALAGPSCPVLIYANQNAGHLMKSCTQWPLWFAWPSPTAPPPSLTAPWATWKFWQWGITGGVDADAYNGTGADLDAWIASHIPPPVQGPITVTTDGKQTLAQIAAAHGTQPSGILRATAIADQLYPANIAAWLNAVFAGTVSPTAAVPAGAVLRIP